MFTTKKHLASKKAFALKNSYVMMMAVAGVAMSCGTAAQAGLITWSGGGGNANWNTGSNWGGTAPVSGDDLVFNNNTNTGTSGTPLLNNGNINPLSITFGSSAGSFFLGGTGFGLGSGVTITQSSANAQSIANNITGTTNNQNNSVTFAGAGTGVVTYSGTLNNGSGNRDLNVVKSGGSTYMLSSSNGYSGGTTINGGTLVAGHAGSFGSGTLTVNNGGILSVASSITLTKSATFNTGAGLGGKGTYNPSAAFSVTNLRPGINDIGNLTVGKNITITNAYYDLDKTSGVLTGDKLTLSTTSLTLASGATLNLTVTGSGFANGDAWTLFSGASGITGTFSTISAAPSGFAWNTSNLYSTGVLSLTALGNNTQLKLTTAPDSITISGNGSSGTATTHAFGRVITGSTQTTGSYTLSKTGTDTTTYTVVSAGDVGSTTISGTSFAGGSQSVSGTLTLATGTTGVKSGTVTIDNTASNSLSTGLGSDDANDVITITGTVLKQRGTDATSAFSASTVNVGRILSGSTFNGTTTISTAGGDDNNYTRVNVAGTSPNATGVFNGSASVYGGSNTGLSQSRNVSFAVTGNSGTAGTFAVTTGEAGGVGDTTPYSSITANYAATALAKRTVNSQATGGIYADAVTVGRIRNGTTFSGTTGVHTSGADSAYTRVLVAGGATQFDGTGGLGSDQTRSVSGTVNAASGLLQTLAVSTNEAGSVGDTAYTALNVNYTGAIPVDAQTFSVTGATLSGTGKLAGAKVSGNATISGVGADNVANRVNVAASGSSGGYTIALSSSSLQGTASVNPVVTGVVGYTPTTGTFTGAASVSDAEGFGFTYSNLSVGYATTAAGFATAKTNADTMAFDSGNALSADVGSAIAGLESQTTAGGSVIGTNAKILEANVAAILSGQISMNWRDRTSAEQIAGDAIFDPLGKNVKLASDVVDLTGVVSAGATLYTLQMSYSDAGLTNEAQAAADGYIFLAYFNGTHWVNAGNVNLSGTPDLNGYQAGTDFVLGKWGVDTTNNLVWAVVDHNSQFAAAVPEPASLGLLMLGGLALLGRRRK